MDATRIPNLVPWTVDLVIGDLQLGYGEERVRVRPKAIKDRVELFQNFSSFLLRKTGEPSPLWDLKDEPHILSFTYYTD